MASIIERIDLGCAINRIRVRVGLTTPELLLIPAAVVDPNSSAGAITYLVGYDGDIHIGSLLWLLVRVILALYLLASALAQFDLMRLKYWETAIRLALAAMIMSANLWILGPAIVVGLLICARARLIYIQKVEA